MDKQQALQKATNSLVVTRKSDGYYVRGFRTGFSEGWDARDIQTPTNTLALKEAIETIIEDGYDKNTRATGGGMEADTTSLQGLTDYCTPMILDLFSPSGAAQQFRCPSCGQPWDTKINSACECGATITKPAAPRAEGWAVGDRAMDNMLRDQESLKRAPQAAGPVVEQMAKALQQIRDFSTGELGSQYLDCIIADCNAALQKYYESEPGQLFTRDEVSMLWSIAYGKGLYNLKENFEEYMNANYPEAK